MDEWTAEQLAAIVGGEAWQSGGGIYVVTVNRDDGSLVVFSGTPSVSTRTMRRSMPGGRQRRSRRPKSST